MKIPDKNLYLVLEKTLLGTRGSHGSKDKEASNQTENSLPPAADRVDISEKAQHIQQLNKLATELPEVRPERIKQIEEKIAQGEYNADAQKIAEGIIRSSLLDELS
ncbi:MAG: flagellar biosynthesis anti-sigma factor FlgM [Nitrospiria bacterium]